MSARHAITILAVRDLPCSVRFYRQCFDWPAVVETPVYVELALPAGMRLGLYQRESFAHNTGRSAAIVPEGATAATELYLQVEELESTLARLTAAGAALLSPLATRDWGDEAAYLADPDGNVLVLARPVAASPSPERLRALARRWVEAWRGCDLAAIDELHAADFVDRSPSGRPADSRGYKEGIVELFAAFPDFDGHAEDLLVDLDTSRVTVRWRASGTHRGTFLGVPPTGRTIRFRGIEILAVRDGHIAERWGEWDGLDLLAQLR